MYKSVRILGYFLFFIISVICILIIVGIGEANTKEKNVQILGLFGRIVVQDWLITPLIMMLLKILVTYDDFF